MFQSKRDDGFLQFRSDTPRRWGHTRILLTLFPATGQQQLGDLLRHGRSALNDLQGPGVVQRSSADRDRVDAWMQPEATILGGNRCGDDVVRKRVGETRAARALVRARLVKNGAVPIEHRRRYRAPIAQQSFGERAEPYPAEQRTCPRGNHPDGPLPACNPAEAGSHSCEHQRVTSMVVVSVRPNTSGSYISSACAGAVRNVPDVVARTTYESSWCPSASLVAKRRT